MESWEAHQADLVFGSKPVFCGAYGRRGTKDVLMAPQLPSLPLKQDV